MGRMLIEGKGVEQDIDAGLQCYQVAIESGNLESSFDQMEVYFEKNHKIHGAVVQAMIYPIILIVVMIIVLIVMMTRIIPQCFA